MNDKRNIMNKWDKVYQDYEARYGNCGLTLAAIEECKSGDELEDFDPSSLDKYIYEEAEAIHAV